MDVQLLLDQHEMFLTNQFYQDGVAQSNATPENQPSSGSIPCEMDCERPLLGGNVDSANDSTSHLWSCPISQSIRRENNLMLDAKFKMANQNHLQHLYPSQ